jgi:farnesyl diphosphate synthase
MTCLQIQDDYLDCYGDPEVIGKIGTDIEDNKCSWLICTALQHATEEQKEIIKVGRVSDVYDRL